MLILLGQSSPRSPPEKLHWITQRLARWPCRVCDDDARCPAGARIEPHPAKLEDSLLGVAAGMMLAASAFPCCCPDWRPAPKSPAARAWRRRRGPGMALGVLLMLGLDRFTPHEHDSTICADPRRTAAGASGCSVFAIAFAQPAGRHGDRRQLCPERPFGRLPLTTAIALQDILEGLLLPSSCAAPAWNPGRSASPPPAVCLEPLVRCSASASPAALPSPTLQASARCRSHALRRPHEVIPRPTATATRRQRRSA